MPHISTALVVDDSPELRLLLGSLFKQLGLAVVTARDGETALALAREHRPDIICLDLMLPTVSGLEVCSQLKSDSKTAAVPVIMVSARPFPQDRAAADQAGADAYMTKPLDRHEFSSRVRSLLWQNRLAVGA